MRGTGLSLMKHGSERIQVVQPPVDRTLEGSSSWLRVAREKAAERRTAPHDAADPGKLVIARAFRRARRFEPASAPLAAEPRIGARRSGDDDPAHRHLPRPDLGRGVTVRQGPDLMPLQTPEPYDPVAQPPVQPPPGHKSASRLERALRKGWFAVTAELNPPDSADPRDVLTAAEPFKDVADSINATDASGANCHMSSMGICSILSRAGYGVVLQISCRDRNRIGIQGDVLGAAAMGVGNILCLTGDGVGVGDQPGARPVFDLDSISLLRALKTMRDEGTFCPGASSRHRRACSSGRPRTRACRRLSGAPTGWKRRCGPVLTLSRPTTSTTCRCSLSS
jgi:hypothetical protein